MNILKFRELDKGFLKGICSIEIPEWGLTIHDIAIFVKGDVRWISFPSKTYEKDGVKKYFPLVDMAKEVKDRLTKSIFEKLDSGRYVQDPELFKSTDIDDDENVPF